MDDQESVSAKSPGVGQEHLGRLAEALSGLDTGRIESWGRWLAGVLGSGHRLLVAGNGGSAAEAQHLTAELVGRFEHDRQPMSALTLHADTSVLTAVGNDYGYDEVFARQVRAHGRAGDVLLVLSTSGMSTNVCRAAAAARALDMRIWALTGRGPNDLVRLADEAIAVPADAVATVQECHLVAIHLLCQFVDKALNESGSRRQAATAASVRRPSAPVSLRTVIQPRPDTTTRLVIVGDTLLDLDRRGSVKRLSPGGPVPVVGELRATSRPGGAGLAALMAARSGNDVVLITALGRDDAGAEVRSLLDAAGVQVVDLGLAGSTPGKTRVMAGIQTLVMLDEVDSPTDVIGRFTDDAHDALNAAAGVLVSDYGRGMAAMHEVRTALGRLVSSTPVVWDPHPRGPAPVPGVCLATPNSREAAHFAQAGEGDGLGADIANARTLLGCWTVQRVAVTRGALGAVLVQDRRSPPLVVNAASAGAGDSCGAGDRFAVAAAELLAKRWLPSAVLAEAVAVASAYVAAGGSASLASEATGWLRLAPDRPDPVALADRIRSSGGTVVAAGGCFDLLHTGHLHLLDEARRLGDCLIVCMNSDDSVARLKGPGRPRVAAADRELMLHGLRAVDAVLVFEDDTPANALIRLRPEVFVKGGDYSTLEMPESAVMEQWGGQVVVTPYLAGRSTTSLMRHPAMETP